MEFDSELYPGFFAWVIPTGEGKGKIGVAGKNINPNLTLENFLEKKANPILLFEKFMHLYGLEVILSRLILREMSLSVTQQDKLNQQQLEVYILAEWGEYLQADQSQNP